MCPNVTRSLGRAQTSAVGRELKGTKHPCTNESLRLESFLSSSLAALTMMHAPNIMSLQTPDASPSHHLFKDQGATPADLEYAQDVLMFMQQLEVIVFNSSK
jgi:hypothetical protein